MLTPEQIEQRRGYIGSSDLAMWLTGKFGGPHRVVADKLGISEPRSRSWMKRGDATEAANVAWIKTQLGNVRVHGALFVTDNQSPIGVNLDAWLENKDYVRPIECKLVLPYSADEWEDGARVNDYTYVQLQAQIAAMDAQAGYIAAWFAGYDDDDVAVRDKKLFEVPRDDPLIKELRRIAVAIMEQFVNVKRLPDPTLESAELICRALSKRDRDPGLTVTFEGEQIATVREYLARKELHAREEKVIDLLKARILQATGEASTIDIEGKLITVKKIDVSDSHCECGRVTRKGSPYTRIEEWRGKRLGKEGNTEGLLE